MEKLIAFLTLAGFTALRIVGILLLCAILIRISRRALKHFFHKQTERSRMALTQRKADTLNSITASFLKYVIYFIGIFAILKQLGVSDSSLVVVASAGSVAIGLGAQNVVSDMLQGFFALFEDQFAVGDLVTIQGITGTVEALSLRSTKIRDAKGAVHNIPNGSLGIVTNLSKDYINAIVDVGVAYEAGLDHTIAVLKDEMEKTKDLPDILETPSIIGVTGLDESAVTIRIVAKCRVKTSFGVEAELRRRIKLRLDAEHIEIPFPQQTVHIVSAPQQNNTSGGV